MKYTRYDMKKKRNDGVVFAIIISATLVLAFIIASILSKLLYNDANKKTIVPNVNVQKESTVDTTNKIEIMNKVVKYTVIQGGMFQKKEYMDETKNILAPYGNPFMIQEDKGTRVLLGIFSESQGEALMKTLKDKNIENSKMTFEINAKDLCDAEIIEIINADIEILNKLTEKNVKSVQTDDLKKWMNSLGNIETTSPNFALLSELKNNVTALPKELGKDKAGDNYVFLYNSLKKLTGK